MVMLVEKSEAIASPELRELALKTYVYMQERLEKRSEIAPFASELFRAIDLTCKHWVFLSPESRMEIVIFSEDIRRAERESGREGP